MVAPTMLPPPVLPYLTVMVPILPIAEMAPLKFPFVMLNEPRAGVFARSAAVAVAIRSAANPPEFTVIDPNLGADQIPVPTLFAISAVTGEPAEKSDAAAT